MSNPYVEIFNKKIWEAQNSSYIYFYLSFQKFIKNWKFKKLKVFVHQKFYPKMVILIENWPTIGEKSHFWTKNGQFELENDKHKTAFVSKKDYFYLKKTL